MRAGAQILALCLALMGVQAEEKCPTDNLACHDVINSSLCLSQQATRNGTAEQMAACVQYDNGMSTLPGKTKLCQCPGCHSAYINTAIEKLFPKPCSWKGAGWERRTSFQYTIERHEFGRERIILYIHLYMYVSALIRQHPWYIWATKFFKMKSWKAGDF